MYRRMIHDRSTLSTNMIAAVDCKPLKNVVQERLVSDSSTAPVHTFQVAGVSWFIAKRKC